MKATKEPRLSPRMLRAVEELKSLVRQRYPGATFRVARAPEEPGSIDVLMTTDAEDINEVMDLVLERVLRFQLKDKLPVHVIPQHTPERVAEILAEQQRESRSAAGVPLDLLAPVRLQPKG